MARSLLAVEICSAFSLAADSSFLLMSLRSLFFLKKKKRDTHTRARVHCCPRVTSPHRGFERRFCCDRLGQPLAQERDVNNANNRHKLVQIAKHERNAKRACDKRAIAPLWVNDTIEGTTLYNSAQLNPSAIASLIFLITIHFSHEDRRFNT